MKSNVPVKRPAYIYLHSECQRKFSDLLQAVEYSSSFIGNNIFIEQGEWISSIKMFREAYVDCFNNRSVRTLHIRLEDITFTYKDPAICRLAKPRLSDRGILLGFDSTLELTGYLNSPFEDLEQTSLLKNRELSVIDSTLEFQRLRKFLIARHSSRIAAAADIYFPLSEFESPDNFCFLKLPGDITNPPIVCSKENIAAVSSGLSNTSYDADNAITQLRDTNSWPAYN